jgi:hypothetical protein
MRIIRTARSAPAASRLLSAAGDDPGPRPAWPSAYRRGFEIVVFPQQPGALRLVEADVFSPIRSRAARTLRSAKRGGDTLRPPRRRTSDRASLDPFPCRRRAGEEPPPPAHRRVISRRTHRAGNGDLKAFGGPLLRSHLVPRLSPQALCTPCLRPIARGEFALMGNRSPATHKAIAGAGFEPATFGL